MRQRIKEHLDPLVGDATLGECTTPFVCVAGRVRKPIRWELALLPGFTRHVLERVEAAVFPPETRIIDAVMASSAIPVVFSPVEVAGEEYVDLLHFGAIPVRTLRREHAPERVLATDTMPRYDGLVPFMPLGMREFMVAGFEEVEASRAASDLLVEPELPASMFRFDAGEAFIAAGREAMHARLEEARALLG